MGGPTRGELLADDPTKLVRDLKEERYGVELSTTVQLEAKRDELVRRRHRPNMVDQASQCDLGSPKRAKSPKSQLPIERQFEVAHVSEVGSPPSYRGSARSFNVRENHKDFFEAPSRGVNPRPKRSLHVHVVPVNRRAQVAHAHRGALLGVRRNHGSTVTSSRQGRTIHRSYPNSVITSGIQRSYPTSSESERLTRGIMRANWSKKWTTGNTGCTGINRASCRGCRCKLVSHLYNMFHDPTYVITRSLCGKTCHVC